MIRDILLGVYALAWLAVTLLAAWRNDEFNLGLWASLGATLGTGVGMILGVFRAEDRLTRKSPREEDPRDTG